MNQERETAYKNIDRGHKQVFNAVCELRDIAKDVSYLHPALSADLFDIANVVEEGNQAIQRNHSLLLNMELHESQAFAGKVLVGLLNKSVKED